MTHHSPLRRRLIAAALTIPALFAVTPKPALAAQSGARKVADRVCDYKWRESTHQLKQLISCSAKRWDSPGGATKALSVAQCESGFNPDAYNPSGYAGVFQHAVRYWPGRADKWGFPEYGVFNGRANIIVAIRMAHAYGWGAWGCA
jgi:hypothetical protein